MLIKQSFHALNKQQVQFSYFEEICQNINSDKITTMAMLASKLFSELISKIENCGLNCATISLKSTFVKYYDEPES